MANEVLYVLLLLVPTMKSLFNVTSSSPLKPLVVHHYQGCVDLRGKPISHGFLFAPGPDECQVCQQLCSYCALIYEDTTSSSMCGVAFTVLVVSLLQFTVVRLLQFTIRT